MPTEPPTCWLVLTIAEATPASPGPTPRVAVAIAGAIVSPSPTPISSSAGRTWVAYEESTPICVSRIIAPLASSMPVVTSGRGPVRGSTSDVVVVAVAITVAIIGRNASPVRIGENPSVCCR